MPDFQALIFDMDGTMVDSKDDIAAAANHALRILGHAPLPHAQLYGYIGHGARVLLASGLRGALTTDPDPDLARQVAEGLPHFLRYYHDHLVDHTQLFPGVAETLAEFGRRGKVMAVATNKDSALTRQILEILGVVEHFTLILGPDNVQHRKPHRESIDRILRELHIEPDRAAMIGDSDVDVQTGRNAGVRTFAVSYGHRTRQALLEAGADTVVDDVRELLTLIP